MSEIKEEKELQGANPTETEPTEEEVKKAERAGALAQGINKEMSEKEQLNLKKMLEEAKAPIVVHHDDLKMGEREVDIRKLSDKDFKQLVFRLLTTIAARLMSIDQTLTDVNRTQFAGLKVQGVENITDLLTKTTQGLFEELVEKKKSGKLESDDPKAEEKEEA